MRRAGVKSPGARARFVVMLAVDIRRRLSGADEIGAKFSRSAKSLLIAPAKSRRLAIARARITNAARIQLAHEQQLRSSTCAQVEEAAREKLSAFPLHYGRSIYPPEFRPLTRDPTRTGRFIRLEREGELVRV